MHTHLIGPSPVSRVGDPPIDVMAEEHALILRAVALLEHGLDRLEAGTSVRATFFEELLDFFKTFADRYHHGKEERILFTFMVAEMDYPQTSGPIAVLSSDHTNGRARVRAMADAVARLESEPGAIQDFVENARAYVTLLRSHIDREDHKVFPTVEDLLGPDEQAGLGAAFAQFEMTETGQGTAAKYADLVAALEREARGWDKPV